MADKTAPKKVTVDGLEYEFHDDYVDDMDFLELSNAVGKGDITAYPALLRKLIGEDKYQGASEFYKKRDGRFKVTDAERIFDAIIKAVDPKD